MIRLVMPIGKSLTDLYRTVTIYHPLTCLMYYLFLSSLWISVEYFGKSENFQSIALYCVLFWENRQLPLCCGFILCVFLWGLTRGYHLVSLDYCGIFREIRKFPLHCTLLCTFLGKPKTSTLLWIPTLCTLLWLQQLHQKSVCKGY